MGFEVSYREHKFYAALNPDFIFSKITGTIIRVTTTMASLGRGYLFFVVDRAWLNDKYIRWQWQGSYSHTFATEAQIWDGEFDRSSMVDFPNGAAPITKGNGILQTLDQNIGSFGLETKDVQVDTSGGTQTKCTIIFWTHDSWNGQSGLFQMDWIEVNEGAGGAGNVNTEHFTDAVVPEVGGTLNDYGYIGYGQADPILLNLGASFEVRALQDDSEDLPGKFISRGVGSSELAAGLEIRRSSSVNLLAGFRAVIPGSEELAAGFIVKQWRENLPAEFGIRQLEDQELLSGFVVRQPGSAELLAGFRAIIQGSEELPGKFIVRQAASQDLAASFDAQVSLNLPGELIVRQSWSDDLLGGFISRQAGSQELPGEFIIRRSSLQELAAKFVVRHSTSTELKAGFQIAWYCVDLLGNIYVRPTGSRATDFEVKDNTRGLTVRDVDRTMTVTAGRRMRVK